MRVERVPIILVILVALFATESGGATFAQPLPSQPLLQEEIDKIETTLQSLHAEWPDLVREPALREETAGPHLLLHDLAADLAEAKVRVGLQLPPDSDGDAPPSEEMVDWSRDAYRNASERAAKIVARWATMSLPPPGDAGLENAWAASQPAFSIAEVEMWLFSPSGEFRLKNTPQLLAVLQGMEANLILADALTKVAQDTEEPARGLSREDVEWIRSRISYNPGTLDMKVASLDQRARAELANGQVQLALASTILAETANTNRRAYDHALLQHQDLLPSLRQEHTRWQDEPPSLLLLHARELTDAILAAAPENATASSNNLGVAAAEALARYSTVALLRNAGADDTESVPESSEEKQEIPWPAPPLVVGITMAIAGMLTPRRHARPRAKIGREH